MSLWFRSSLALGALALATVPAQASLITSLAGVPAGATLEDFNAFGSPATVVAGSLAISPQVTLNNLGATVQVGQQSFSLINNGDWNVSKTGYVALNGFGAATPALTFSFATPVRVVAVFMNYGFVQPVVRLTALDSANAPLESYNLIGDPAGEININIGTEGFFNNGRVRGIARPTADIAALRIDGDFVAVDDLRFASVTAPEPGTLVLGLPALIVGWRRRRR